MSRTFSVAVINSFPRQATRTRTTCVGDVGKLVRVSAVQLTLTATLQDWVNPKHRRLTRYWASLGCSTSRGMKFWTSFDSSICWAPLLVQLLATADNRLGPINAEKAFDSIHQSLKRGQSLQLRFAAIENLAGMFLQFDPKQASVILGPFQAHYPHVKQEKVSSNNLSPKPNLEVWTAEVNLQREFYNLRDYTYYEDLLDRDLNDPVAGILGSLYSPKTTDCDAQIEILITPASMWHVLLAKRTVRRLMNPFFRKSQWICDWFSLGRIHRSLWRRVIACAFSCVMRIKKADQGPADLRNAFEKAERHCFEAKFRIKVFGSPGKIAHVRKKFNSIKSALGPYTTDGGARFALCKLTTKRNWSRGRGFLLSTRELATLFHPTTELVKTRRTKLNESRQLEPPVFLPSPVEPDVVNMANAVFQESTQHFGMSTNDRLRHLVITGKTGQGKTELIKHMVYDDIRKGRGVALMDPHGDLVESLLQLIPSNRTNNVVLFDASDFDNPPSYQPIQCRSSQHKPVVAEQLMSALMNIFGFDQASAPRMQYILRNALLALLEVPGTTLMDLMRLIQDGVYRQKILQACSNEAVIKFWQDEFDPLDSRTKREWIAPIQNKVGTFTTSEIISNILNQPKGRIDFREIMDNQKILLIKLSKGRIGDTNSKLLGTLIASGILANALSRADIAESDRVPFYFYVDEFQNFASDAFAVMMDEARKYRLGLVLAHQHISQLVVKNDTSLRDAIFGNVGSLFTFRLGIDDAEYVSKYFGGHATANDIAQLPQFNAFALLQVDGSPKGPFSVQTLPPMNFGTLDRANKVRLHSRRRYCRKNPLRK